MSTTNIETITTLTNDVDRRGARAGLYERETVAALARALDAGSTLTRAQLKLVEVACECDRVARRLRDAAQTMAERLTYFADSLTERGGTCLPESPMDSSDAVRVTVLREELKARRSEHATLAEIVFEGAPEALQGLGGAIASGRAVAR